MIKAETCTIKTRAGRRDLKIKVTTSIDDDLKDFGDEVIRAELVSIFKQLYTIDPEILIDALEIYTEDITE